MDLQNFTGITLQDFILPKPSYVSDDVVHLLGPERNLEDRISGLETILKNPRNFLLDDLQNIGSLSNYVSRRVEEMVVRRLNESGEDRQVTWKRNITAYPDCERVSTDGESFGIEIKCIFFLNSEYSARCSTSVFWLEDKYRSKPENCTMMIIVWELSHVCFGEVRIKSVMTIPSVAVAMSRDNSVIKDYPNVLVRDSNACSKYDGAKNLEPCNVHMYARRGAKIHSKLNNVHDEKGITSVSDFLKINQEYYRKEMDHASYVQEANNRNKLQRIPITKELLLPTMRNRDNILRTIRNVSKLELRGDTIKMGKANEYV